MSGRRMVAEFIGTALLLVAIVGSGIATSVDGPHPTRLLQHAVVVGAALSALILALGPTSGAHFNPAVTLVGVGLGTIPRRLAAGYVGAQLAGASVGVALANFLFEQPVIQLATVERLGLNLAVSEVLATFGLLLVIFGPVAAKLEAVAAGVGAYIAAAIFFTPSTSFANPAVTLSRIFTPTWTGIAPNGVLPFLAAQVLAAGGAFALLRFLRHPARGQ